MVPRDGEQKMEDEVVREADARRVLRPELDDGVVWRLFASGNEGRGCVGDIVEEELGVADVYRTRVCRFRGSAS